MTLSGIKSSTWKNKQFNKIWKPYFQKGLSEASEITQIL